MKYLPHRTPQLLLPDGDIIPMAEDSCQARGTVYQSQREIYEEIRQIIETVRKVEKHHRAAIEHHFRCVDGICRNCGMSRARYEFSKPKPICNPLGGSNRGGSDSLQDANGI